MTRAYPEIYLTRFRKVLGEAFDHAINTCGIDGNSFIKLFLGSTACIRIERGEPNYLVGKSGIELASEIVWEIMGKEISLEAEMKLGRSAEYWIGWAVAYYQWYSDRKFMDIFQAISFDDLRFMYHTLHETDITKFVDIAEERIKAYFPDTNLKRFRSYFGYSQAELSRRSGVSLRSIQMYEQRKKDINKASVVTVYQLAKCLGCTVEDLIEH